MTDFCIDLSYNCIYFKLRVCYTIYSHRMIQALDIIINNGNVIDRQDEFQRNFVFERIGYHMKKFGKDSAARMAALTLALLLTITSSACGGEVESPEVTTADIVTTEAETTEAYPSYDFGGQDFNIFVRPERLYYLDAESQNGDVFNDAVFERNSTVEALCNVNITYIDAPRDSMATMIQTSVMAGDGAYDLVMLDYMYIDSTSGIYLNLLADVDIDFDKKWWCQGWNDNITIDGKIYSCVGDYCLDLLRNTHVVYFSKPLIYSFGLENPYELVKSGKWTIDKMAEMGRILSNDMNADGVFDANDSYGIYCNFQSKRGILQAMGELLVTFDNNGSLVNNFESQSFESRYNRLYKLLNEDESVYYADDNFADFQNAEAFKIFNRKELMFIMAGLFAVDGMRTSDVDFGIVPVPKADETQESYQSYNHGCSPIAIPKTVKDPQMSAAVLDLLMRVSSENVVPVYYNQVLKGKVSRDEESAEMLDLIFSNLVFDFTFINDVSGLWADINSVSRENLSSLIASNLTAFNEAMNRLMEKYAELD